MQIQTDKILHFIGTFILGFIMTLVLHFTGSGVASVLLGSNLYMLTVLFVWEFCQTLFGCEWDWKDIRAGIYGLIFSNIVSILIVYLS